MILRGFDNIRNMWHWERITAGPNKGAWMHPCFIRGNKVLCSYMSRHFSVPKANVPLHWMCPTKLIPSSEKIDSNRLTTMMTRGIRDLASEAFYLLDDHVVLLNQAQQEAFSDQIKSKSPTDSISKNVSHLLPSNEIVRKGDDHHQEWIEDKRFNGHGSFNVPISILEPTPLREDFQSNNNIGLMTYQFPNEEIDVFRDDDYRSCHTISLLLEPLSDETMEDFF